MAKRITLPLSDGDIRELRAGDSVLLTGTLITGRDAAHKRLYELLEKGEPLPVDVRGEIIYYVGPAPAKPGYAVGPAGPTSSYRMDKYAPSLLDLGLKGMIGKGARGQEVIDAIVRNKAVYLVAIGGAAALIAKSIKSEEILCYEDLGTEAVRRYEVEDFPCIVAIDSISAFFESYSHFVTMVAVYFRVNGIIDKVRAAVFAYAYDTGAVVESYEHFCFSIFQPCAMAVFLRHYFTHVKRHEHHSSNNSNMK